MVTFPQAKEYEEEFKYMPWGILVNKALEIILKETPEGSKVLDLMCGPGYLLGEIRKQRKDLQLLGVDINTTFIEFARAKYKGIEFIVADVLSWDPSEQYDVIVSTGGLHHVPYEKKELFLQRASDILNTNGFCVFADPYIGDYSNEQERQLVAARLGYEYLIATIKNGAPKEIVQAALDILGNDIGGREYKTSLKRLKPVFEQIFPQVEIHKTWPEIDSEYGDYCVVCRK